MKFTIAALAAFVSSALAALSINNPVANTVWAFNGSPAIITWVSDDNTVLTGTVTVQLMEGADTNNLMPVLTIASNIAASLGKVSFTPPSNLPGSKYYAVRVTASVDGPHYSHQFQAGNPAITGVMSPTAQKPTSTSTSTPAKPTLTTKQEEESVSSSGPSSSSSPPKSSSNNSSSKHSSSPSSSNSSDSSDSNSDSDSDSSSPSSSSSKKDNSAARPAVVAAGALGAAIVVALF
ncbi:hypothetical protein GGH94_001141 [Coemansia aciculifera]|uniref:Yeast cell wall synthesis Kre9/Knh1-like N-terminal domain-containing protein n=1 Tax=Coemansia aciculifera TaxID=417176 RepID=A0A9W8INA8_9FUNG|nr:hypothetical protein GGH94_001141 [Coemansia aciculifera]KAJ2876096.1 hypothetical protein GGH93_001020 [Coemansia aciculifera]KAJ2884876.1 hypothetical protein H4R27_001781 [Coemansia aciculifera]